MSETPHKLVGIQQLLKATEEKFKEWLKRKKDNLLPLDLKVNPFILSLSHNTPSAFYGSISLKRVCVQNKPL